MSPYQSHEVSVLDVTTLRIDQDFRLSWSNDFSANVTPNLQTLTSDVLLHILPNSEEGKWVMQTIRNGSARSPEFISHERDISNLVQSDQ